MLVRPSKVKENRILRGRTLSFETIKNTHGNMIFIPTMSDEEFFDVIKGKLFKPVQLMSLHVPRIIRPANRPKKIIKQADYYKNAKKETNGIIKIGKLAVSSYGGKNLILDFNQEYKYVYEIYSQIRKGVILEKVLKDYFESIIARYIDDSDYEKKYIIFPVDKPMDIDRKDILLRTPSEFMAEPSILFLRSIAQKTIDKNLYSKIDGIFFYNPNAKALIKMEDLNSEDFDEDFMKLVQRFIRLNNYNRNEDTLDDEEIKADDSEGTEESPEDEVENDKEKLKDIILKNVGKSLKANLTDYEAADKNEQELITDIDKKIDSFISKPENLTKNFSDLVNEIEKDQEVKKSAIKYVESKKAGQQKIAQMSKNLDKEAEILDNIQELSDMDDEIEVEEIKVDSPFFDERVEHCTLSSIDEEYNKKQYRKDLVNTISAFSNSSFSPMALSSLNIEDTSDDFDSKETAHIKYKTDDGKILAFTIDIPKVVDKRYFYLGGNKKLMTRQLIRLPIIKTKVDRVEITTAFNKMTIERTAGKLSRKNEYLLKFLEKAKENPAYDVVFGANEIANAEYKNSFEYEELSSYLSKIKTPKYLFLFNRNEIKPFIELLDIPSDFINDNLTPIGFSIDTEGDVKTLLYLENDLVKEAIPQGNDKQPEIKEYNVSEAEFILKNMGGDLGALPKIGKSFVYTKVKFLQTVYPVLAVVGLKNGLSDILKRYKINYYFSDKAEKRKINCVDVVFKDKILHYEDTVKNTLLLNALYLLNTENYYFSDFDTDLPYNDFFIAKLGSSVGVHVKNTLKLNLEVMVDPVSKEVLRDLKLPTDITDLLLEANTMLINSSYRPQNDIRNYRVRGTESLISMLYKIIADAYVGYQRHKINGQPGNIEIPRGKLLTTFLTSNIVGEFSFLNPTLEAEEMSSTSPKGPNGINLEKAYTLEFRAHNDSMDGFLSANSTPYSGSAGITRSMSYDPKITSIRGYIPTVELKNLSATNMLATAELLSPFAASGADNPRQAMLVSQSKHVMPTIKTSKALIGSGVQKTLPFIISDTFCFKAKKDGVIEKIDNSEKLAILKYDDGSKDAIDLSPFLSKNANSGFYIEQEYKIVYKEGERFKKGDAIAYNPSYFSGKGRDISYRQGVLAKIAIAPGDFSFEDSTLISEKLADKCKSYVVMDKGVSLGKNAIVHSMVKIGDKIKVGDNLIEFTSSFDKDTSDFLQDLASKLDSDSFENIAHEAVHSKYTGDIVDIRVYYNTDLNELSKSLRDLIKAQNAAIEKRKELISDIKDCSVHLPPVVKINQKKVGKTEFDKDGGVIIKFFIRYESKMDFGNKLSFSTALKGVISNCLPEDVSPVSEYRPEEVIEGVLTPTGILSRMTSDIYKTAYCCKALVECGKQIREIWEGKR